MRKFNPKLGISGLTNPHSSTILSKSITKHKSDLNRSYRIRLKDRKTQDHSQETETAYCMNLRVPDIARRKLQTLMDAGEQPRMKFGDSKNENILELGDTQFNFMSHDDKLCELYLREESEDGNFVTQIGPVSKKLQIQVSMVDAAKTMTRKQLDIAEKQKVRKVVLMDMHKIPIEKASSQSTNYGKSRTASVPLRTRPPPPSSVPPRGPPTVRKPNPPTTSAPSPSPQLPQSSRTAVASENGATERQSESQGPTQRESSRDAGSGRDSMALKSLLIDLLRQRSNGMSKVMLEKETGRKFPDLASVLREIADYKSPAIYKLKPQFSEISPSDSAADNDDSLSAVADSSFPAAAMAATPPPPPVVVQAVNGSQRVKEVPLRTAAPTPSVADQKKQQEPSPAKAMAAAPAAAAAAEDSDSSASDESESESGSSDSASDSDSDSGSSDSSAESEEEEEEVDIVDEESKPAATVQAALNADVAVNGDADMAVNGDADVAGDADVVDDVDVDVDDIIEVDPSSAAENQEIAAIFDALESEKKVSGREESMAAVKVADPAKRSKADSMASVEPVTQQYRGKRAAAEAEAEAAPSAAQPSRMADKVGKEPKLPRAATKASNRGHGREQQKARPDSMQGGPSRGRQEAAAVDDGPEEGQLSGGEEQTPPRPPVAAFKPPEKSTTRLEASERSKDHLQAPENSQEAPERRKTHLNPPERRKTRLEPHERNKSHLEASERSQSHPVPPERSNTHLDPPGRSKTHLDPSGRSNTHLDPPERSNTHLDPPGRSKTHLDPSGRINTHLDPPERSNTHLDPPGRSKTHLDPSERSKTHLEALEKSKTHLETPEKNKTHLDPPGRAKTHLEVPERSKAHLDPPEATKRGDMAVPRVANESGHHQQPRVLAPSQRKFPRRNEVKDKEKKNGRGAKRGMDERKESGIEPVAKRQVARSSREQDMVMKWISEVSNLVDSTALFSAPFDKTKAQEYEPIRTLEQIVQYQEEFQDKYKVYIEMFEYFNAKKATFEALQKDLLTLDKDSRNVLEEAINAIYTPAEKKLDRMLGAYRILEAELQSLKKHLTDYADMNE